MGERIECLAKISCHKANQVFIVNLSVDVVGSFDEAGGCRVAFTIGMLARKK